MREQRVSLAARALAGAPISFTSSWTPLGPVPLASDASGIGIQDYHQVSGRATAIAIDPADGSGNTVYIGGAQGGVWKSTTAANPNANTVAWLPVADDAATLSVGSIAIQPGNTDPTHSVILVGTGEANDTSDSYFGLGILVSTDGGSSWTLMSSANSGALSFSGLGGTQIAFSTAQPNTVVASMGTSNEGAVSGALSSSTLPGLYTSTDAGQHWTYDVLLDPGNQLTDATSGTSVVYNAVAGMFFASVRYHGFYSSPDGLNWTRLANQPGNGALSTLVCPPISASNNFACPVFRAELTAVPGRNEIYAWMVSLDGNGNAVDGGIWQTLDGGNSWAQIVDSGITNCGDSEGCGVVQGFYNLALIAMPNGSATDLYAGAINLYKCSISVVNPTCNNSGFLNLTHVYGCDPIAAPSHVHPDQHALAFAIPTGGSDNGGGLIYIANDGGIYRALNGYTGLNSSSCSATNQFDDLNQNLGSMTQFVTFSQHPTDENTMLGGTQNNGSPGTSTATTNLSWGNVNGGDGGFNAIDPATTLNWFTSNPDVPPGGLNIQECSSGINCHAQNFSVVVGSNDVGGDDGAFYFPYVLDPQSGSTLVVGTCRIWRGPRTGGAYTVLSPNFDTLGAGTCLGTEVNVVRSIAAGGPADGNGSEVIYATTDGPGPLSLGSPAGGNVWVTTNASAGTFSQVTQNINPNQFPVSGVAIDTSDATGNTAFVTIMGFTGGAGHVWQTRNAGATWTDFTGTGITALPDAPANAVAILPGTNGTPSTIFLGTDVGVFATSATAPSWTEVGPNSSSGQAGFLPNTAVTALAIFNSGNQELLRASTYGRGIWQFNLNPAPDYQLTISNPSLTVPLGQTATFNGVINPLNGYNNSITLSCVAGTTLPPKTCIPTPSVVQPGTTAFTVAASDASGAYNFNIQGVGSDANHLTRQTPVSLQVTTLTPDFILSEPGTFPTVNAGSVNTSGVTTVTATNNFVGTITLTCSVSAGGGTCTASPSTESLSPTELSASFNVTINATGISAGTYQFTVQGISGPITHTLTVPYTVSDYQLSGTQSLTIAPGAQGTANLLITPVNSFSGSLQAACEASALSLPTCSLSLGNPILVSGGAAVPLSVTIGVGGTAPGAYTVNIDTINTSDVNGAPSHSFPIAVTISPADFSLTSQTQSQTLTAGQTSGAYQLTIGPNPPGSSFLQPVTLSCSLGALAAAQCIFNPSTPLIPGNTSTNVVMTVSTSTTTSPGNYPVTITATSGALSHSVNAALVVTVAPARDFTLTAPASGNATAGTLATISLALTSTAATSINVQLSCDDTSLPGAQTCATFNPQSPYTLTPGASVQPVASIQIPADATPGQYNIKFSAQDATGSQTVSYSLVILPDFSVINATPPQTITAGQTTGAYQLSVGPNPPGSVFSGAVSLSCAPLGLPPGAQCIFAPSTPVIPGGTAIDVVLTISTTATTSGNYRRTYFYAFFAMFPGIVIICAAVGRKGSHWHCTIGPAILFSLAMLLASCGGPVASTTTNVQTTGATTYAITVVGTSGSLTHDANVGLVVEAP